MVIKNKNTINEAAEMKRDNLVIYFKANRPLTIQEHKNLREKIAYEESKTGLKIVLVPFLVDLADGDG